MSYPLSTCSEQSDEHTAQSHITLTRPSTTTTKSTTYSVTHALVQIQNGERVGERARARDDRSRRRRMDTVQQQTALPSSLARAPSLPPTQTGGRASEKEEEEEEA